MRVPAQEDAEADAQEARHKEEVVEEADVDDVRRDPAEQQQLDEEQRGADHEEKQARPSDRVDGAARIHSARSMREVPGRGVLLSGVSVLKREWTQAKPGEIDRA